MKFGFSLAAVAAASLAFAAPASAKDDDLTYATVTRCAAFNLLLAQVYGVGDGADKEKVDLYTDQAASLMVVATMMSDAGDDAVAEDIKKQNSAMLDAISDDKATDKLLNDNLEECTQLGQAAKQVLDEEIAKEKK